MADNTARERQRQLRRAQLDAWFSGVRRIVRIVIRDPLALIGSLILLFIIVVGVLAPVIATHDPHEMNTREEGVIYVYDEGDWRRAVDIPGYVFNAVDVQEAGVYAAGNQGVVGYYEGGWHPLTDNLPVPEGERPHLYGVSFPHPDYGVVVGEKGTLWQYQNGEWEAIDTGVTHTLYAVELLHDTFGFAVGEAGTILKWDGSRWEQLPAPAPVDLRDLALYSEDVGLVAGTRGALFRWAEGSFTPEQVGAFRSFLGVDIYDPETAVAVGERGTTFHYREGRWQQEYGPESRDITGVSFVHADSITAIGQNAITMAYREGEWDHIPNPFGQTFKALDGRDGRLAAVGADPYINRLAGPSRDHLFGTTHLGRDIFSQTVYGTRTALLIGFVTALIVNLVGVNFGLWAGYFKGRVDNLLMRIVDVMYGLPFEPFAMILVMLFRPSVLTVIFAISFLAWRSNARIIRSQVLSISERPFIKAAKVAGASHLRILYVHIAPNILPLAFLQLAVAMGGAITAEATLSFLGLGPPRVYSWGTILHAARLSGAWRTAWWWIVPPGFLIMITVVSVFFIARVLEVLTNPRLEGEIEDA